jgi:hypothetical protein
MFWARSLIDDEFARLCYLANDIDLVSFNFLNRYRHHRIGNVLAEALRDDLLQFRDVLAARIDLPNERRRKCPVGTYHNRWALEVGFLPNRD